MSSPKKNVAYDFYLSLIDSGDTGSFKVNPTIAAGDFKVSTDGGAFTNLATLPVVDPAGSIGVKVSLSSGEMNGDKIMVQAIDAAGDEWDDVLTFIDATTANVDDIVRATTPANTLDVDGAGDVTAENMRGTDNALPAADINLTAGVVEANLEQIQDSVQSVTDLKDFADDGYDPATNKVEGVKLVDTTTANSDMRGTENALLAASAPTNFGDLSITVTTGLVNITQAAADKVWSSASRTLTAFSTALAVSVWDVLESAIAVGSSIGVKLKTNLDVVLSTRLASADINISAGIVESNVKQISDNAAVADALQAILDGTGAKLTLAGVANEPGLVVTGAGTGPGALFTGGLTGHGIEAVGGATSGDGIHANADGDGSGMDLIAVGANAGLRTEGGATGPGIHAHGGATGATPGMEVHSHSASGSALALEVDGSGDASPELVDDIWDEAKAGHVGAGSFGEEVQSHALSSEVAALNDFDPATDIVANVTLVDTTTDVTNPVTAGTVTDKTGYSLAATGLDLIVSTATGMVEMAKAVWDRILSGATHNINTSAGRRLRQIQENLGYELGAVWFDSVNGAAGSVAFENGTVGNRTNNVTDMNTLLASVEGGLSTVIVNPGSTMTFAASQNNQFFTGSNWTLALGGRDITGTQFNGGTVSGIAIGVGTQQRFEQCIMGAASHVKNTYLTNCIMRGTQTVTEVGDYFVISCASGIAGSLTWTWDFAALGATNLNVGGHKNGIQIDNMAAGDVMSLSGQGQLIIDASCTGGLIEKRGDWKFTDNSGGAVTIVEDLNSESIAAILADSAVMQPLVDVAVSTRLAAADITLAAGEVTVAVNNDKSGYSLTADIRIKKNTALTNFYFPMIDSADNVSLKTGLTVAATRSIDGAAFGATANAPTELSNGMYLVDLDAADLNGDTITLRFTSAGANDTIVTIITQTE